MPWPFVSDTIRRRSLSAWLEDGDGKVKMVPGRSRSWCSQNSKLELVQVDEIWGYSKAFRCWREIEVEGRRTFESRRGLGKWYNFMKVNQRDNDEEVKKRDKRGFTTSPPAGEGVTKPVNPLVRATPVD